MGDELCNRCGRRSRHFSALEGVRWCLDCVRGVQVSRAEAAHESDALDEIIRLWTELKEAKETIRARDDEISATDAVWGGKVDELREQVGELTGQVKSLTAELAAAHERIRELEAEVKAVCPRGYCNETEARDAEIAALTAQRDETNHALASAGMEGLKPRVGIYRLHAKAERLDAQCIHLTAERDRLLARLESYETKEDRMDGSEMCVCGHVWDEHGTDPEHQGSTACHFEEAGPRGEEGCHCCAFEQAEEDSDG